jgi:hypothetical protein
MNNSDYYIVWMKAIGEESVPVLLDRSREMKIGVPFQTTSLDIAMGILHEYWKPADAELSPPTKDRLLEIYTEIIENDFNDTLINSVGGITSEARKAFGFKASLNQLFSAYCIFPNDIDIKQNLNADILNIFLNGESDILDEKELLKLFRVVEEIYTLFPIKKYDRNTGFQIAKVYLMALCVNGSISKAHLLIQDCIKDLNLNNEMAQELRDIANSSPNKEFFAPAFKNRLF